jgi:hypothetical protein
MARATMKSPAPTGIDMRIQGGRLIDGMLAGDTPLIGDALMRASGAGSWFMAFFTDRRRGEFQESSKRQLIRL